MEKERIISTVNAALAEEFELDPQTLTPGASLREDLNLDSLDIVDMVIVIEQAFGFKLPDRNAIQHISTLGDIYEFIEGLEQAGALPEPTDAA